LTLFVRYLDTPLEEATLDSASTESALRSLARAQEDASTLEQTVRVSEFTQPGHWTPGPVPAVPRPDEPKRALRVGDESRG
jgi:hypothetical protein